MKYQFTPQGVCSRNISFELNGGKVENIEFTGGCNGNAKGLGKLAQGMDARELVSRLRGTTCGMKPTSCPDQLAIAVEAALEKEK